jgi:CheY-like chemotaxis protein
VHCQRSYSNSVRHANAVYRPEPTSLSLRPGEQALTSRKPAPMSEPRSNTPKREAGAEHLARRSAVLKRIHDRGLQPSLLVVENKSTDAQFIETPLRRLFGQDAVITVVPSVTAMIAALEAQRYSVIVLDDNMEAGKTAETTLPLIQASAASSLVILVSAMLTRGRIAELHRLGAHAVLAKDDIDSVALGSAILRLLERDQV